MGYNRAQQRGQLPEYLTGLLGHTQDTFYSREWTDYVELSVWHGVLELEPLLVVQPGSYIRHLTFRDAGCDFVFEVASVEQLLHRIRMEARTRLINELAPKSASLAPQSSQWPPPSPPRPHYVQAAPLVPRSAPNPLPEYIATDFNTLVGNSQMADLLARRWQKANRAHKAGAYLSVILMLGGILEGVLVEKISKKMGVAAQSANLPRDPAGNAKTLQRWTLSQLISVAADCGWLKHSPTQLAAALHNYPRIMHPTEQLKRSLVYPDEQSCKLTWEVVQAAILELATI